MVGFVNLLSSRQKALQKQCLKGRKSRMYQKGGVVTARGWLISLKMSQAVANASDRQLRWVWVARGSWTTQPDFMYLGYWRGSQGKIHLLIAFEYYIWIPHWPQEMNGLCSWFLQPLPDRGLALAQSGITREPGRSPPQKSASERFASMSFLSHWHSSPWNKVLAPFSLQDFVLGELEHLSTDRLPLCIWARLTGSSALTNDVIDGQNKEEHTKKHFCLVWCVSKPSSSGCWRYILLHASLHSNGIPRQSCFFSWHKTAGSFMGAGPTEPGGRSSTKERSFPKVPQVAFLLSWI